MVLRKSSQDYYDAALQLLESGGFPALTAVALCDVVGVTRGSFYHHFSSFDGFVDGLLEYWEARYTRDMIALTEALDQGGQPHFEQEVLLASSLPHGAEAALRSWSTVEPRVASAQHRVDTLRLDFARRNFVRQGLSPERATVLADVAVASLVGLQALERPVDPERLRRVFSVLHDEVLRAQAEVVGVLEPVPLIR